MKSVMQQRSFEMSREQPYITATFPEYATELIYQARSPVPSISLAALARSVRSHERNDFSG